MAVKIRSVALGAFRFVLVYMVAVVALVGATFAVAVLIAWLRSDDWTQSPYLIAGLACGLIAFLFTAVFHLRRETHIMPFTQREQFLAKTETVLQEMGYHVTSRQADALSFGPRFHAYLFGGAIHVALQNQEATLTGPKVSLEMFRRSFRLFNHVQRVQIYLRDKKKITENVLKRVELRLQLQPRQFEAVRKHVIELLEKEGQVACRLSLLVNSEKGVRENILEVPIRAWPHAQGIDCEIHNELVHFVEVAVPEETTA